MHYGKTCFAKEEDPTFKLYYRGQMIGLIRKIILAACDPNHDCTGDTKRETNLKNEMEIVRKDDLTVSHQNAAKMILRIRPIICPL